MKLSEMDQIPSDRFPPLSSKYPWLVAQSIQDDDEKQDQFFFCTIHNDLPHYRCRIPELLGKRIRGFCHGWVILSNHPYNNIWSLWNQVTSKIIGLPNLVLEDGESYESIRQCCLSAPPDDPTSILLLTTTNKSTFLFCPVDSKREDFRWTEMSYAQQLKRLTSNGKLLDSLTCCNGKVYALNTDGTFANFVLHLDIVVKYNEVVINLMVFGACPFDSYRCEGDVQYLKGSSTELFYIEISFDEELENIENKPADMYLYKLDITCINWEERELCFKDWDITNMKIRCPGFDDLEDSSSEDSNTRSVYLDTSSEIWKKYYKKKLDMSREVWKVIDDLKDAIFYLDLARDYSVSYSPVVASELGGFIHIRGEMGKTIYSYNVKDNTISLSSIPSPMLPTSHVSMWECRLEDDHGEAKCIVDYEEEMGNNNQIFLRSGTDNGVEFKNSHLLDIPFDLLEMIMELCVGMEYMNFRATCKQCLLAAPLIKWSNETSLRRLQTHSPWLMVVDARRDIITFTDPLVGDNYFMKNSQVIIDEYDRICYSRFGWLLFKKRDLDCLVFFNPFTNDLRELPETEHDLEGLCFSAPPTSLDCVVVGFTTEHAYFHFVNRERTWHERRLDTDPHTVSFSGFYGRDLYVFCKGGELIVINNLGQKKCSGELFEAEPPKGYCRYPTQYFITNCDQHRLLVSVGKYGEGVEVFKRNDSEEDWEKIDSVGKHTIYICGTAGFCIEAKEPKMENKIFFPRLHTKNRRVVFYSLDTCRYHTFDAQNFQEEHLEDFFRTTHHLSLNVWIEPSWS